MLVKIEDIIENKNNPRFITEELFNKLVNSIKEDPEIIFAKPLVVTKENNKFVILGGNMRFKALKFLNYTEVPIFDATDWSDETKKRFIVKDNVSSGSWDYSLLANDYEIEELSNWGLNVDDVFKKYEENKDEVLREEKSKDIFSTFEVIIECSDAQEQEKMFNDLTDKGHKCRILNL